MDDANWSNPPVKTIESDIYEAFAKAGAILKANAADPGKAVYLSMWLIPE
jgi:hypothetical protein